MTKKDKNTSQRGGGGGEEKPTRIAIVNSDKCRPRKCNQECKNFCPVVRMGKLCIQVERTSKIAEISEVLCIGCGICVRKCPFGAIQIINVPKNLERETVHRYGSNAFKLHRCPVPRPGQVLGLVGANGTGKSTALKILSGKLKPNLGRFGGAGGAGGALNTPSDAPPPDWAEILRFFRGSELQSYFERILRDDLKAVVKPQYVDQIGKTVRGTVREVLQRRDELGKFDQMVRELDLTDVLDRQASVLSGGELQRFAIAVVAVQRADVYMVDEPSSYLDVRQRLRAARVLRDLRGNDTHVIAVEHDLAVLDYLSDFICCLYGAPGAYGVITYPFSVREGINIFLAGYVPTENMRFREAALTFRMMESADADVVGSGDAKKRHYAYPSMTKRLGDFCLDIDAGEFTDSEIMVLLAENGMGKTTMVRLLAGLLAPDEKSDHVPELNVSYKPQKISPSFDGSVRALLHKKIQSTYMHAQFQTDVVKPLGVDALYDQAVQHLSGGELQRVALVLALGKPADVYLLDEPSAYLDSEQRIIAAKVIKRFVLHAKKTAFVVEHDFIMATYLADRVIVYEGEPARRARACAPQSLLTGMNRFLASLSITFRRDPTNMRPRINKHGSVKDQEQKASGNYFFAEVAGQSNGSRERGGGASGGAASADDDDGDGDDDDQSGGGGSGKSSKRGGKRQDRSARQSDGRERARARAGPVS